MVNRSKLSRKSNSLTLLNGTSGTGILSILTGNQDPNAPVATLNHSVDLGSIGYMVAGGAALIIFSHIINSPNKTVK
jgi:hypothetical protein